VEKLSAKVKRPLWVAGLNAFLIIAIGSSQAFAATPIANQSDLVAIGDFLGGDYVLTKSFSVTPTNIDTYISGEFTGTIDGDGFTISGLNKPLFNHLGVGSLIKDLNLDAGTVSGRGILANRADGRIENAHVTGNVTDPGGPDGTGGLVGTSEGSISGSSATGNVTGEFDVGGLVGSSSGSISSSWYLGDVRGDGSVGGLVGSSTGDISGSFAGGSVLGIFSNTGGLVGISQGAISNSYASGDVTGSDYVGGLVGYQYGGDVSNSYATGSVTGNDEIGGLVGYQVDSHISNSYASGDVNGNSYVGGLVGTNYSGNPFIVNSYASGAVNGYRVVGGLVGDNFALLTHSYSSGVVTSTGGDYIGTFLGGSNTEITDDSGHLEVPFTNNEILNILNRGSDGDPIFALNPAINNGLPYLISNAPPGTDNDNQVTRRVSLSFLPIQVLDGLRNSVGFEIAKSDLNKLDLALLDKVKDDKAAQIIGAKLPSYQSLSTYLSIGSLLQLEINYEANKSLQIWVKSSDDQYVLIGDITFDKDGNAVLPGIEFKKSGLYEFIFVNSAKKGLAMPELANKVSGLTVYVN